MAVQGCGGAGGRSWEVPSGLLEFEEVWGR